MDNRGAFGYPPIDPRLLESGAPVPIPQRGRVARFVVYSIVALFIVVGVGGPFLAPTEAVAGVAQAEAPHQVVALATNPLLTYPQSLAPGTCTLPKFGRTTDELRAYLEAELTCLDAAWKPVITPLSG